MIGGRQNLRFPAHTALAEQVRSRPDNLPMVVWRPLATDLDFVLLGFQTCTAVVRFRLH